MTRNEVGPSRWQHLGHVHGPAGNLCLVNRLGQDANKTMGQTVPHTTNKAELEAHDDLGRELRMIHSPQDRFISFPVFAHEFSAKQS
jgi:hypothetical protein